MRTRSLCGLVLLALVAIPDGAAAATCDDLSWYPRHPPQLGGDGGTLALTLSGTAGCTYQVSTYAAQDEPVLWIHAEQSSVTLRGTGDDVASFRFDPNPGGTSRMNHLYFQHASGASWSPTVDQDIRRDPCGYALEASRPRDGFGSEGGSGTITVQRTDEPECPAPVFSTSAQWIHVGPDGAFTVDPNDSGDREGTITVSAPPRWAGETLTIYQAGVARMDGGGSFDELGRDPLADTLVNEEPGPEAALVLGAVALAAVLALRRR